MKNILIIFGTRPEAIKMAPVVLELRQNFNVKVCVTAQHRKMLDQVMDLFNLKADYDLDLMRPDQDLFYITTSALTKIKDVISDFKPNLVLVHGDTTTSMAAALASFYNNIPVGHVEAGLRTNDIYSPFPEELNRQITSRIAKYHFAPTENSKANLLKESISGEHIYVTGNTVIDALHSLLPKSRSSAFPKRISNKMPFLNNKKEDIPEIILVTGHRRENFGKGFEEICYGLSDIATTHSETEIIYPVHLNPNVSKPVNNILTGFPNIHLIEPMDYLSFIKLLDMSRIVLTDSGGIQEEAPSLGKPVLLMRSNTERPEAIEAGTIKLVGASRDSIYKYSSELLTNKDKYVAMAKAINPYGDGDSSNRISKILMNELA